MNLIVPKEEQLSDNELSGDELENGKVVDTSSTTTTRDHIKRERKFSLGPWSRGTSSSFLPFSVCFLVCNWCVDDSFLFCFRKGFWIDFFLVSRNLVWAFILSGNCFDFRPWNDYFNFGNYKHYWYTTVKIDLQFTSNMFTDNNKSPMTYHNYYRL